MKPRVQAVMASLWLVGCAAPGGDDPLPDDSFEQFASGKEDTGYLGTRAAELEASFRSVVQVVIPDKTPADYEAIRTAFLAGTPAWQEPEVFSQIGEQIRYARNSLKAEKLDLNLESGEPSIEEITATADGLEIRYKMSIESLVKYKELEQKGITPRDLVGKLVEAQVPRKPAGLFERVGSACAADPNDGSGATLADLRADNLFFFWAPNQPGCSLTSSDLSTARYEVKAPLIAAQVYPEYDQLIADGQIDIVELFGQIEHGQLGDADPGWNAYTSVAQVLQQRGFVQVEEYPDRRGVKLARKLGSGLLANVELLSPANFADTIDRALANEVFANAVRTHEVVYYAGHAFYGSLSVLDHPEVYLKDRYQIIFMDACWSYAYYTKQVFKNKATPSDPTGFQLADVVNNTEPALTGSEMTAANLWDNLLRGADAAQAGRPVKSYSWNNLIEFMNLSAERRSSTPEIYGVSGVGTNRFFPKR